MTSFIEMGNIVKFNDDSASKVHKTLPVFNYILQKDPFGGLYLEKIDSFPKPGKLYGDVVKHTDRILKTFLSRKGSTGVMLSGEKGSGKTLLAKNIVINAAQQHNIPTIVINSAWAGDTFSKFLQDIHHPCIVMFDEFEKVYDREAQQHILTLLDGSFPSQKLFILTTNDKWRIDEHMRNRPGRIFYMIDFDGLTADFIREYCEDNLDNKEHIQSIVTMSGFFNKFNFDMLKALVEEMNRYGESPQEATKMLNTKVEYSGKSQHKVTLKFKGRPIECDVTEWMGNPVMERITVWYEGAPRPLAVKDERPQLAAPQDPSMPAVSVADHNFMNILVRNDKYVVDDETETALLFGPEDIISIDPNTQTTIYKQGDHELVLKKSNPTNFSIWSSSAF